MQISQLHGITKQFLILLHLSIPSFPSFSCLWSLDTVRDIEAEMIPHGFFDSGYISWIQMTDPPDDAVLVNGLDLFCLHHRPVTDTVRIPENVVGLLER